MAQHSRRREATSELWESGVPFQGRCRRHPETVEVRLATWFDRDYGSQEHGCQHSGNSKKVVIHTGLESSRSLRRGGKEENVSSKDTRRVCRDDARKLAGSMLAKLISVLFFLGVHLMPADALAPAPHNRACPGPLTPPELAEYCVAKGILTFEGAASHVLLSRGRATVWVQRLKGFAEKASVQYRAVDGSAVAGREYVPAQGTVSWDNTEAQPKPISIALVNSGIYRQGSYETSFSIELFEATGGADLGNLSTTTVTVVNTNAEPGVLSLTQQSATVSEGSKFVRLSVTRSGGSDCNATVNFQTVKYGGRGDRGYYGKGKTGQSGHIMWVEGDSSAKEIAIPLVNDVLPFPDQRFYVELFNASCAPILEEGRSVRTLVTVIDDDQVGFLRLSPTVAQVLSDQGNMTVTISRLEGTSTPVSANYVTIPGTAVEGQDYERQEGLLVWRHGEFEDKKIVIPLLDGGGGLLTFRTFKFQLTYLVGIELLDGKYETDVQIKDVQANPGNIVFKPQFECRGPIKSPPGNCYYFAEGEAFATLVLQRIGGILGDISVRYTVNNVTSDEFGNFQRLSGVVSWDSLESADKTISIPLAIDRAPQEIVEFARVTLSNYDPLVPVVDPQNTVAYIGVLDRDSAGFIRVTTVDTVVAESVGIVRFALLRVGAAVGRVVAYYETLAASAIEGLHFEPSAGNVTWEDEDNTSKEVEVMLVDDRNYRFGEYFRDFSLRVVSFSNNTFADPRSDNALVTIVDDNAVTGQPLFAGMNWNLLDRSLVPSRALLDVREGAGSLELRVERVGGLAGNLTVLYHTEALTAHDGEHFAAVAGNLTWFEGDVSPRNITVPILDNDAYEPAVAFRSFLVVLQNVSFSNGTLITGLAYKGPQRIEAEVVIEEEDGPGVVSFAGNLSEVLMRVHEGAGEISLAVSRRAGSSFSVSVGYATVEGTATHPLKELGGDGSHSAVNFSSSCAGASESGVRRIQVRSGEIRELYCDVSDTSVSASMLIMHSEAVQEHPLWERECISTARGSIVNSFLWDTLSALVLHVPSNTERYFSMVAAHESADSLQHAPGQQDALVSTQAQPVPFPLNGKIVWFDWPSKKIVWAGADGSMQEETFDTVGISENGGMSDLSNNYYFITDGIGQVHVGNPNASEASLLTFNWDSDTVSSVDAQVLDLPETEDWCRPQNSSGAPHLLWTVNGRTMYRNCRSGEMKQDSIEVVLGGPIIDPGSARERFSFVPCDKELLPECGAYALNGEGGLGSLGLFAHVDGEGFLHLGATGASDGGLLGCGSQASFGMVRTSIELGRVVADDFEPASGRLVWDEGDRADKFISLQVRADGAVDEQMLENLYVELSVAQGAVLDGKRSRVELEVLDAEGAGQVTVRPGGRYASVSERQGVVLERGDCCENCDPALPLRMKRWCANATVERGEGTRGAVCVVYETRGKGDSGLPKSTRTWAERNLDFLQAAGTLCWGHLDNTTREVTVKLPYEPDFLSLQKTILLALEPPAVGAGAGPFFSGEGYGGNASQALREAAQVLVVQDTDAVVGRFSIAHEEATGMQVLSLASDAMAALLWVRREDGSDLDAVVHWTTEVLGMEADTNITVPVSVRDGAGGSSVFCLAATEKKLGTCADSSSAFQCAKGECTVLESVDIDAAQPANNFQSPGRGRYLPIAGTLVWESGQGGRRGIAIPVFPFVDSPEESGTPYRAFRVTLSAVQLFQHGDAALEDSITMLPPSSAYGDCNPEVCVAPHADKVVAKCSAHGCRVAESSEAFVVLEQDAGAGVLRLVNTTYFVPEGLPEGLVRFTIQRVGGRQGSISVRYRAVPINVSGVAVAAIPGYNVSLNESLGEFASVEGLLAWEDGDMSPRELSVEVADDATYVRGRMKRAFSTELHSPTGGAILEEGRWARTTIIVDDDAKVGSIGLKETVLAVDEDVGSAIVQVARVGGADSYLAVQYHTGEGLKWSSTSEQTGNSSAHPLYLSEQTFACQTTLDGQITASVETAWRGGGGAALAMDQDNTSFWDADAAEQDKWIQFHFEGCELGGGLVGSYEFTTADAKAESGCPADWVLLASVDGVAWKEIDARAGETCSPSGRNYAIGVPEHFMYYRWVFSADQDGFAGVRLYEIVLRFAEPKSTLLPARMCDVSGDCCEWRSGSCDALSGHKIRSLAGVSFDYEWTAGFLEWGEGDDSPRTIAVPIKADCLGCTEDSCTLLDQLQDKPLENFPLSLAIVSDLDARNLTGDIHVAFPYKRDPPILPLARSGIVTIVDSDGPGVLALHTTSCGPTSVTAGAHVPAFNSVFGDAEPGNNGTCAVLETAGRMTFVVTRTGGASRSAVSVDFIVLGHGAELGVDFEAVNGTLRWAPGDRQAKNFEVRLIPRPGYTARSYARVMHIQLLAQRLGDDHLVTAGGAGIWPCQREVEGICVSPARSELSVMILDEDAQAGAAVIEGAGLGPGTVYSVDQPSGFVTIRVLRLGGADLPLTVSYETVALDNGARPCSDTEETYNVSGCEFFPVTGQLFWADGDSSPQEVNISLNERQEMRVPAEDFIFRIRGALDGSISECGGYNTRLSAGSYAGREFESLHCGTDFESEVTVTIRQVGRAGYLALDFLEWPAVVSDDAGVVSLVVDRLHGTEGIVSVIIGSSGYPFGGSAIPDTHFVSGTQTLSWADGDDLPKIARLELLSGSVPTDEIVDLKVTLLRHSLNTDVWESRKSTRLLVKAAGHRDLLLVKTIQGDSDVQNYNNTLSVKIKLNTLLGPGGQITISGLTGTQTLDDVTLPLGDRDAEVFGGTAAWTQSSGTLLLTVARNKTVEFLREYRISFVLTNPAAEQNPPVVLIAASGSIDCPRPQEQGRLIACPADVSIASAPMKTVGTLLAAAVVEFSSVFAESHSCLYAECPHSPVMGAENFVTVTFESPADLPASTVITLSGLSGAPDASNVSAILNNIDLLNAGDSVSLDASCSCYTPVCTCEHLFTGLQPSATLTLTVKHRCNSLGVGVAAGDWVKVRAGFAGFWVTGSNLTAVDQTCMDECDTFHTVLQDEDVSSLVNERGMLHVSIASSAEVDFCGDGDFLNAQFSLTWTSVTNALVERKLNPAVGQPVGSSINFADGTALLEVPEGYTFKAGKPCQLTIPVRNVLSRPQQEGVALHLAATGAAVEIGRTRVTGRVMLSDRTSAISWASVHENTRLQEERNMLSLQLRFSHVAGGSPEGLRLTISGLDSLPLLATSRVPLLACTSCLTPTHEMLTLGSLAGDVRNSTRGTAEWDPDHAELRLILRGDPPLFLIPNKILAGSLAFDNAGTAGPGDGTLQASMSSELVPGSGHPTPQPVRTGGLHEHMEVLTAAVQTSEFNAAAISFDSVAAGTGYAAPAVVTLSWTDVKSNQWTDAIIIELPGLTTCNTYLNSSLQCSDIPEWYLDALPESMLAGAHERAIVMTWNESAHTLMLRPQPGRALCANATQAVDIRPQDYGCEAYTCALKVLPDHLALWRGKSSVSTDALRCGTPGNTFCTAARKLRVSREPVLAVPGYFFGQEAQGLDPRGGRAFFAGVEHDGRYLLVGGITPEGLANDTLVTANGTVWEQGHRPEFAPRALLAALSWRGEALVLGGRGVEGTLYNDVWRLRRAEEEWCLLTSNASWAPRHSHIALNFEEYLWVIGGASAQGGGRDIWRSSDGVVWALVIRAAPFGRREGAAGAVFNSRMWVYGGAEDTSTGSVWWSTDGLEWYASTLTAPWANRMLHAGLVHDGRLWVVGGYDESAGLEDVWQSSNGSTWTRASPKTAISPVTQFGPRFGALAAAFSGRILVIGGSKVQCKLDAVCVGSSEGGGCDGFYSACAGNDVWADAFRLLNFVRLEAQFSSSVLLADNLLHLKFALDSDLPPSSSITLSGLRNFSAHDPLAVTGPSSPLVRRGAEWRTESGEVVLTLEQPLLAFEVVSLSVPLINPAGKGNPLLQVAVQIPGTHYSSRGQASAWLRLPALRDGEENLVLSTFSNETNSSIHARLAPFVFDGGVMFDVVAQTSVTIAALILGLQPYIDHASTQKHHVQVYYKEGTHNIGAFNLSEWLLLGRAVVNSTSAQEEAEVRLDALDPWGDTQVGANWTLCAAAPLCEGPTECDHIECRCRIADVEQNQTRNLVEKNRAYDYMLYTFCRGETYCGPRNDTASCICTQGARQDCRPAQQEVPAWLGPRESWVEDTESFRSSTYVTGVDLDKVLGQEPDGMWHSGNGSSDAAEHGCPHLPRCPPEWPYARGQWLAFDLGTHHALSRFRIRYPDFTLMPAYTFHGLSRTNIREEYWLEGHPRDFSFQFSRRSLDGPWITLLDGTAAKQAFAEGWQTFAFEPETARYWRFYIKNNYGFGYTALGGIELFGFQSRWQHLSNRCHWSLECSTGGVDRAVLVTDGAAAIRESGLVLAAGRHSLFLHTNLGLQVAEIDARRGEVVKSDGRLAITFGSAVEAMSPLFAFEDIGAVPGKTPPVEVSPQAVTVSSLLTHGFVLAARFVSGPAGNLSGVVLALGDPCKRGLTLWVLPEGGIRLRQGCTGGEEAVVESDELASVEPNSEYTMAITFSAQDGELSAVIQRLAPLTPGETVTVGPASLALEEPPFIGSILIGAASSCGKHAFSGAVRAASIYAGALNEASLAAVLRRRCRATAVDGSCVLDPERFVEEQQIETRGAMDADFLTLPVTSWCFRRWRLHVTASAGGGPASAPWCLRELVLFQSAAPQWVTLQTLSGTNASAGAVSVGYAAEAAFDSAANSSGKGEAGGETFCSAQSGAGPAWVEVDFEARECVAGYAILAPDDLSAGKVPGSWVLQGSDDGKVWTTVDSRAGEVWQDHEWKRFETPREARYLLFSSLFDETTEWGYNTFSDLHAFVSEAHGWQRVQRLETKGARKAVHFEADDTHFIALAESVDSTQTKGAMWNDGVSADSRVGSNVWAWSPDRRQFAVVDTLPTNNSASVEHFVMHGRDYLVLADHRRKLNEPGLPLDDTYHSLLLRRTVGLDECGHRVCLETDGCGCDSCACRTMLQGESTGGSGTMFQAAAALAFDGDHGTAWRGVATEGVDGGYTALVGNADSTLSTYLNVATADIPLALEFAFVACPSKARVVGYSMASPALSCPRVWQLQGSDDGATWVSLDTRTRADCPWAGVLSFYLPRDPPATPGDNNGGAYGVAEYKRFRLVFAVSGTDLEVEVLEVELLFEHSINQAYYTNERGATAIYDVQEMGPPFSSTARDDDGHPVARFWTSGYPHIGVLGPVFDVELSHGTRLTNASGCQLFPILQSDHRAVAARTTQNGSVLLSGADADSWHNPLAPFEQRAVCFSSTGDEVSGGGFCSAGLSPANQNLTCTSDSDCPPQSYCLPRRKYGYRVSFKRAVRLLSLSMSGCGWCNGSVLVTDVHLAPLARRDHSTVSDCTACNTWRLAVNATGVEFNIVEDNLAPFSLRTAIAFEWEPHSDWKEVQLLPSTRAHDITYFTIDGVAHLAMANYYQGDEPCYGDVWCLNKRGTDPMDSAAAAQPHHINSSIFRHDGQQFVLHQEIATRGALDMEHFVISGRHFLAVANSFENVLSSSDTTSDIYVWDSASADGAGQFVLHQAIATQGARAAKHMVKDGRHLLLLSNTFDGAGARYGARPVLYRWGGSRFEAAGELPAVGVAGVSVTTIHGTQYLAVASYYNGSHFNTNSKLLRFADAFAWHGAVRYADNAAPSAHFLERRLGASSNVSNAISMINVSLRADRGLPVATRITIGGLEGSTTPSGALPLSGAAGTRFNSTARWDAESMQAVLTLAEAVPANDTLSLVFELRNNVTLQAAVQSWVETGGPVAFPRMSMHGEVLGVAEIADSAWNFVESRQAVTVRDAPHNQLEFELEAAVDIPSDSRIHITGLKGATSAVEHISLSGIGSVLFTSEDPMLARSIRWNNTDKSLTAIVGDGVAAFERFVFSLNLSNAWTLGGVHPNVSVTTADGVLIPATPSRSAVFLYKEVPGFTVATIEDSHRVLSGENEFTLRLQPNLPLMLGARISISGLAGSSDPDRVVPIGGPHKHRFKYHIAVFAAAEETLTLTVGANCRTSCLGGTCSTHDAPCLFPFTFERFPHWQCTQAGGAARPWCATSEEFAGSLDAVSPHWGFCVCEPSIPDDEVTTITFKLSNSNQRANDFAAPEISASAFVNIPERPLLTRAGSVAQVFGAESSSQALTLAANEQAVTSPLDGWRPLWEFSVELWCQTAAGASLQILTVEPEDGGLAFAFESGVLVLTVNGSSTTSDDALSDGEWHHLAATWKSATGEVLLYLDGVEAGSATGIAPGAALNVTGGELTLGDVSGATAMKLAQVRIWSLARSPSGVPSLADTSHVFLTGALPAGLIAYYNFAAAGTDISRVAGDLYPKDGTQGGVLVTEDLSYSTVALEGFVWPGADWRGSSAVSTEAYAGGDVCLNVSLASSVSIGPGAEIYLGNLGGLQEGARVVPVLQLPSDAPTALSWGLWEHDAARFSFALVKPLHTGETLHVRFTLIASLRAEEMPERELTIAAMDGAVESYGDSPEHGDKPEGPPPATVPGAVLLLHNLTDENALTCNGSVSVPWAVVVENSTDGDNSTENDNSLCPTFSSCTAEEAPPCSCVAACPVAAFKVNDVETNLSLLDLKSPLWQPGLLVAEESLDSFTRNISIQLQPDRTLPAGSLITIQGLTGSLPTCPRVSWPMRAHRILQLASLRVADRLGLLRSERVWIAGSETEDREASETCDATSACFIQLSGEHARSLNVSWARWEQLQGRLTLALSSDMPGNLPFHFSVVLGAPFLAQAVVPSIEVSGPVRVPPTLLCAEVLVLGQDARVLQAVVLAESTCSPCEMNNVTLALRPNVALPVGTRVTLSGLDGTLTPDQSGVAPVEGRDRYRVARGLAEWSAAAGQAVLELGVAVAAREDISLALLLHNGRFSQRARGVRARFSLPGEAAAAVEARAQMLLPAAGGGGVLSFQGRPSVLLTPEAVNGTATAQWMATQWRKTVEASGNVWVKSAVGACCVGACCAADSCCTCSHLKASGIAEYNVSGRYFRGSPCEMYCDQETDGGGWTLLATVTNAGSANRWTVDGQSASEDPTDWVRLYGTNYWEEAHYAFGQADPSVHQDFRSWAFMRAAGDGNGAGEQLMVTAAEQDEATQTLLLQTDGACLDGPLAGVLANLSWECNGSGATPLFDTLRPGSSVDSPVAASLPCAHACGVARSNRSRAEGALVGTSDVHQLYLKAGGTAAEDAVNQAGAETAANSSISDRVYLSTEWREHSGVREAGLGSTCDGDANEEAFGRSCGADVGGVDGSEVLRYSLWARSKTLWRGDCSPPLRRRGDACVCCTCPPGESHNGGQCVACPAGRYKATDADEPCKLCAGTDVLGEGQSECPHTLEIVVEVAEAWSVSRHRTFYDHPRDVAFSFKWNETGTWSETVVLPASTNTWGANLTGVVNTTLRFVGTPVALRYSLKHYTDLGVWRPASIAVRVNRGRWYEPQQDLCDLDSSCRPGDQCPSRTIATEGGLDCGFSAHTSGDVNLLPSVNISQIEDLLD